MLGIARSFALFKSKLYDMATWDRHKKLSYVLIQIINYLCTKFRNNFRSGFFVKEPSIQIFFYYQCC